MRLFRDPPHNAQGIALTIGNFDGVHLGHQLLLAETLAAARARGLVAAALTFEPHPREFFDPAGAPPRLSSLREKALAIRAAGIEHLYVCRFDRVFCDQPPAAFLDALRENYRCRWLLVGDDFRFGARRAGSVATLRDAAGPHGFELATLSDVNVGGAKVSSTAIRQALAAGDFRRAEALLGRRYAISGHVVHGRKLGRTLGFPTANIALSRRRPALSGVFAVKCAIHARGLEGVAGVVKGVASLGTNPAVKSDGRPSLEVFLFDFSGDLYGRRISVEFREKLRDEARFDSIEALVAQMRRDSDAARLILGGTHASTP